jgi:site-specific DNA recombinase
MTMTAQHLRAAIYARVSSERQAREDTIASQLEALDRRIRDDGLGCDPELRFIDDGVSGTLLLRPGLERLRDQAAAGSFDRLYVQDPDRFSRKYAYQVLILEELARCGVEVVFLCNPHSDDPAENLLVQLQGMIAEYERAKIMERSRRGKRHAARRGSVNVLAAAPYGYHYVCKREGDGEARYQVVAEEARVARRVFEWVGRDHCSLREVARRLKGEGVRTRTGLAEWNPARIGEMLKNPAYKGTAAYGKTRAGPYKPQRIRPPRGQPDYPKTPVTRADTPPEDQIPIDVPALVDEALFAAVQERLEENRKRKRDGARGATCLLQGLIVCKGCGYACHGAAARGADGPAAYRYYRCRGSEAWRHGGQKLCRTKGIRADRLDAAVWEDVASLLSEPERVREEYRRRLGGPGGGEAREAGQVGKLINQVKRTISRLIDAYGEGLLEKSEFEPRVTAARERLSHLEEEHKERTEEEDREGELRLVIGQLEGFASRVSEGLDGSSWPTRREIVRALVKRVEVDEEEVRIVYRVGPSPFEGRPQQGLLQHCWGRRGCRGSWKGGSATVCSSSSTAGIRLRTAIVGAKGMSPSRTASSSASSSRPPRPATPSCRPGRGPSRPGRSSAGIASTTIPGGARPRASG